LTSLQLFFLGHGTGIGSATVGILSLFIALQALTQAGIFLSIQPSHRLKSMRVNNRSSVPARTFFGRPIPANVAAPAVIFKKIGDQF